MALQLSRRSGPSPPHGIVMPNPNSPRSPAEPASRQVGAARTASPRARAHLIGPGLDTRGGQNSPRNNRNPYATLARMTKTEAPAETVAPSPRGSRDPVRTLASSTASTADSIPVGHVGPDPAKGDSTPAVHPAAAPVRTDPPQRRTGVHASPRQHPNTLAARKSNKIGEGKDYNAGQRIRSFPLRGRATLGLGQSAPTPTPSFVFPFPSHIPTPRPHPSFRPSNPLRKSPASHTSCGTVPHPSFLDPDSQTMHQPPLLGYWPWIHGNARGRRNGEVAYSSNIYVPARLHPVPRHDVLSVEHCRK